MIPAVGYQAAFDEPNPPGKPWRRSERVVAWSDDGEPLIVDRRGDLVNARSFPGFKWVEEDDQPVVAAISGAGWTVRWTDPDTGASEDTPVICFTVRADGTVKPARAIDDGDWVEETDLSGSKLIPPSPAQGL